MIQGLTNSLHDYRTAFREGTCFIQEFRLDEFGKLPPSCLKIVRRIRRRPNYSTILLWGDFLGAAHLYQGLKEHFGATYRLIQMTSTGCPPIMGFNAPHNRHCVELNRIAFDRLIAEETKPSVACGCLDRIP